MKKSFRYTMLGTFFVVPFTSAVFAAGVSKPVAPPPSVVATQSPTVNDAAKIRANKLHMRNNKAKAASGSVKKGVNASASPEVDSAASKKNKRLMERNMKARETTKAQNTKIPKETAPK